MHIELAIFDFCKIELAIFSFGDETTQIPYLTEDEAIVVQLTLEFLKVLIDGDSSSEDSAEGSAWSMKRQVSAATIHLITRSIVMSII